MTASVCHQSFDLPIGHVSALLPTLQRAWNESQRAFDNSALTKLRGVHLQVWATVRNSEGTEAMETAVQKGEGGWGGSCAAKLQTKSPTRTWGNFKHCPSKFVTCHRVWRNRDRVAAVGEWLSANSGSQVNPSIRGKSLGHQEVNIITADKQIKSEFNTNHHHHHKPFLPTSHLFFHIIRAPRRNP